MLQSERGSACDSLVFTAEKARQLSSRERGFRGKDLDASIARCIREKDWIPKNTLIVQYIVTPEKLIIAAMNCGGASFRSVAISEKRLKEETGAFIAACNAASGADTAAGSPAGCRESEARARSLYTLLIGPIDSLVAGKETLCFISDEPLRRIPIGALLSAGADGRFLVEEKNILSSPNLLAMRAAVSRGCGTRAGVRFASPLIVGEPDIGACLMRNYPGLEALPGAQNEIIEIRNTIGRATILAGPFATKEAVLAGLVKADCIHVATHRVAYPAFSGRSALLFSTADDCDVSHAVEASLLTENEIEELNLSGARLVVLSACESAAAEDEAASESMGLAGAFLEAGAQTVIATVWPIEDMAARRFATAFYRELDAGKADPGAALQAVQRKIIQGNRSNGNPAQDIQAWAPYLIIGSL